MSGRGTPALVAAGVAAGGFGILYRLGRTAGSTPAERRRALPGDELVARPSFATDHAITIDAPPSAVWPWLVQMGWGRAGWYTARWVDRMLFPANRPSADRIVAEWQHVSVGDRILDGPPELACWFTVEHLDAPRAMVLHSTTHLPPGWAERHGATIDWSWAFVLTSEGDDRTRFAFRSRARLGPAWVAAVYRLTIVPADLVMATQMLRGVRRRAERAAAVDRIGAVIEPRPRRGD